MHESKISSNPATPEKESPQKSTNKTNFLILAIAIIIGILSGEIVVRTYVRGNVKTIYQRKARQKVPNGANFQLKDILAPSNNPRLVYELIPYRRGAIWGVKYQSNSFGIRGPEISKKKPAGVWRIAGLGDSTMFGWKVRENEAFLPVLERALNSVGDPRRYEVLNFAVPGYNTAIEAEIYRTRAREFDPDLVIIHFDLNDLALPNFVQELPPFFTLKRFYLLELIKNLVIEKDAQKGMEEMSEGELHEAKTLGNPSLNGVLRYLDYRAEYAPAEYRYMVGWQGVQRALDLLWNSTPRPILHLSWIYYLEESKDLFAQHIMSGTRKRKDGGRLYFLNIMTEGREFCREMGLKWNQHMKVNDFHPSKVRHVLIARAIYLFLVRNRLLPADSNHYRDRNSEAIARYLWDEAKEMSRGDF